MRYKEIICEQQMLEEAFFDTISKAVAGMASRPFQIVNNTTSALTVIKDVISDEKKCQSVCFLLRKQIIRIIQTFPQTVKDALWKIVPRGYTVKDFLSMIILLPAGNFLTKKLTKMIVGDSIEDTLKNLVSKLTNISTIASGILAAGAQGIFGAFKALGLADELLFQTLDNINKKMKITATPATDQ